MTGRDTYELMLTAEGLPDDDLQVATFLARLRAARAERRRGLAWAEYEEGLWAAEADIAEEVASAPLRLAAESGPPLDFPATYTDGTWTVVIGLDLDGTPYLALDAGPGPVTIVVDGAAHPLAPGSEARLSELVAPPRTLLLRLADGTEHTLRA
jgi:hypothetical protein